MNPSLGQRAAQRYAELTARLHDDGRTLADVARVREYVHADLMAEYGEIVQARAEALGAAHPAVTTTVVQHLWSATERQPAVQVDADLTGTPGAPDGTVYLPSVLPIDDGGAVVAPGDFRAQYSWCLERAGALLDGLGLSLAHLVQTIDFSTGATRDVYARCARPRRELLGPVYPGAAGILVDALPHPDALVGFELVASRHLPVAVNPGWARYETLTYNPAVRAGNALFGSGFAALDPVSQQALHAGDAGAQTAYTYGSITAVLAAAGAGPEHLVRLAEYVCPPGVPAVAAIDAARTECLPGASAPVIRVGCATLLRPEFLLEVVPTAMLPDGTP